MKAKDRDRNIRAMAGTLTLTRNYHHCERCQHGFYPLDRLLELPEESELTYEMEKRVLDFAVNDVFDQGAERWNVHYRIPISDNLLRRVAARVGAQCEAADPAHLQEALTAIDDLVRTYRTAGARSFHAAILRARRQSERGARPGVRPGWGIGRSVKGIDNRDLA